jgi:hypothetical protein
MSCLLHFANELFSYDLLNELLDTFVASEYEVDWDPLLMLLCDLSLFRGDLLPLQFAVSS